MRLEREKEIYSSKQILEILETCAKDSDKALALSAAQVLKQVFSSGILRRYETIEAFINVINENCDPHFQVRIIAIRTIFIYLLID
jgi:hypothetical protein